jgi:membrane associated rhomboid family serine protease
LIIRGDLIGIGSILVIILIVIGLLLTLWKKLLLTHSLLIVNVIIFLISLVIPEVDSELGFRPEYLFSGQNMYTIITSMYLHADAFHLLFNMIFLAVIGLLFEEKVKTLRYGIIYYITGIAAAITFSLTSGILNPDVIIIGASGGLFGILGAYARLYPNDRFAFFPLPYPLPIFTWAFIFLLIAMVATFVPGICIFGRVAHLAHVGGLFAGLAMAPLVMKIKTKEKKKVTRVDLSALEAIAITQEDKELLQRIKSEDEPDIRRAWLEHFLARAKCPRCQKKLEVKGRAIKCECGFQLRF